MSVTLTKLKFSYSFWKRLEPEPGTVLLFFDAADAAYVRCAYDNPAITDTYSSSEETTMGQVHARCLSNVILV